MAKPVLREQTYLPADITRASETEIDELVHFRQQLGLTPRLVDHEGREIPLPAPLFDVIVQVAQTLHDGLAVTVVPRNTVLSTQEAADLLGVSRMTVTRLLDRAEIPYEKPSRHRKLLLSDVLAYKQRQRAVADEALTQMVSDAEVRGYYDLEPEQIFDATRRAREGRTDERHND